MESPPCASAQHSTAPGSSHVGPQKKKVMVRKVRKVRRKKSTAEIEHTDSSSVGKSSKDASLGDNSARTIGSNVTTSTTEDDQSMIEAEKRAKARAQTEQEQREMQAAQERAKAMAAEEELQREIEKMEKAIQQQQKQSGGATTETSSQQQQPAGGAPRKRLVKRKVLVKKKRQVPSTTSSSSANNNGSDSAATAKIQEDKTQAEIRKMEASIAAATTSGNNNNGSTPEASPPPKPGPATMRPNLMSSIAAAATKRQERVPSSAAQEVSAVSATTASNNTASRGSSSNNARPSMPVRPNLMNDIATAASKREQRVPSSAAQTVTAVSTKKAAAVVTPKHTISNTSTSTPDDTPVAPRPPPPNLMSAITAAATSREERLEETNGELLMQEVAPEVDARPTTAPQLSFALTEMVTKKAKDREKRLAEGGEKKMTKIKEKEEYRNDFKSICIDAAAMGRLTRLAEKTVEAVAVEKDPMEAWKSGGLLAIQWRSNHMSVIHDAAALGNQTKMREKVVSNNPEWEDEFELLEDEVSPRMQQLMELNGQVGAGQHKVDKLILGRKEEASGGPSMIVRPMMFYNQIEDVKLPKKRPPKIDPTKQSEVIKQRMAQEGDNFKPLLDISKDVAEKAWERRMRLDRPGGMPKIQEACPCPYCVNPSPFQTHAYREKERRRVEEGYESPTSDDERRMAREARRMARKKDQEKKEATAGPKEPTEEPVQPPLEQASPKASPRPRPKRKKKPAATSAAVVEEKISPPPPPIMDDPIVANSGCACVIM